LTIEGYSDKVKLLFLGRFCFNCLQELSVLSNDFPLDSKPEADLEGRDILCDLFFVWINRSPSDSCISNVGLLTIEGFLVLRHIALLVASLCLVINFY
jgi:hypothetical protein